MKKNPLDMVLDMLLLLYDFKLLQKNFFCFAFKYFSFLIIISTCDFHVLQATQLSAWRESFII